MVKASHSATPLGWPQGSESGTRRPRARLVGLDIVMALVTVNIWTGAPLAALWLGSQVQSGGPPTLLAVTVVVAGMAVLCYGLVLLLGWLGSRHDRLTGRRPAVHTHAPWLRSVRGERMHYPGDKPRLTTLERILVAAAVLAFLALEVMFFLFPNSPLDPTYAVLIPA